MPTPAEPSPPLKFRNAEENDFWRKIYGLHAAVIRRVADGRLHSEDAKAAEMAADGAVLSYRERIPSPSDQRDELERKVAEENDCELSAPMSFFDAWCVAQGREDYNTSAADAWAKLYADPKRERVMRHYGDWLAVVMPPVAPESGEKSTVFILDYVDQVLAAFKTELDALHSEAEKAAPTLRRPHASGDEARASDDPIDSSAPEGSADV